MTCSTQVVRLIVFFILSTFALSSLDACNPNVLPEGETGSERDSREYTHDMHIDGSDASDKKQESSSEQPSSQEGSPEPTAPTTCSTIWPKLPQVYPSANSVGSCENDPKAQTITKTLLQLRNRTIHNNGATERPCIEARCDKEYVYIVTNALPHYDFVQTTPNALKENQYVYRIPITPTNVIANANTRDASTMTGCTNAYAQFISNSNRGTQTEPSGFCILNPRDTQTTFKETVGGQTVTYHKLACFGPTGFVTSGVPIFGPNEAAIPDPYGNPFVYMPDTASEPYIPKDLKGAAAMDLCFGHTAFTMHYHGINQACFERNNDGTPKYSFAKATSTWDWKHALTADCKEPSGVIGWSFDGLPIKGPCVCMKRKADGSCEVVKRARSSWVYRGLKEWGTDPGEAQKLGKEATSCTQDSDCCTGTRCRFRCKYAVVNDAKAPGGSRVGKHCILLDYAWCGNAYIDRSKQDVSGVNFIYMDRCNGTQSADGYAYHVTASFPMITGCFRRQPSNALQRASQLVRRNPPRP